MAFVVALAITCIVGARAMLRDHRARQSLSAQAHDEAHVLGCSTHAGATPRAIVVTGPKTSITLQQTATPAAAEPNTAVIASTRWRITAPIEAPADDAVVDAFVQAACSLTTQSRIAARPGEPPIDLALFQLAPPRHQVSLVWPDNTTSSLDVGDVSAYNSKLYVRRTHASRDAHTGQDENTTPEPANNQPAEQVDGAFEHQLNRDLHAWREKRPFVGLRISDIDRVEVHVDRLAPYTVTAHDDGIFRLEDMGAKAAPLPADAMKVREWLSALIDVHAEQFVAQDVDDAARKRFALYRPKNAVTLHLRGGATRTLLLGQLKLGTQDLLFAQGHGPDGPILRLATSDLWGKLHDGMQALQDMRVLHLDAGDVTELTVEHAGRTLSYRRTEASDAEPQTPATWHVDHGPAIEQDKFMGALHHLLQMRAANIVTRAASAEALRAGGLVVPKHTITLAAKGGRPLAILWLGNHAQGQLLVTDDSKQIIWSVFEGTAEQFTSDPTAFAASDAPSSATPTATPQQDK